MGVNLASTGNSGWTITNNKLYQTANRVYSSGNTHIGISAGVGSGYTITGNTIGYANSNGTGATNMIGNPTPLTSGTFPTAYVLAGTANATRFVAINAAFTAGGANSLIQSNVINGINIYSSNAAGTPSTSATGTLVGINVQSGNATIGGANTSLRNTLGATSGNSAISVHAATAGSNFAGIFANTANTISVQNNTIGAIDVIGISSSTAGGFIGFDAGSSGSGSGSISFTNNIVGNTTTDNIRVGYLLSGSNLGTGGTLTSASGTSAIIGFRCISTNASVIVTNNTINGIVTSGSVTTFAGITTSGSMLGTGLTTNISSNSLGTSTLGLIRYAVANSGAFTGISRTNTASVTTNTVNNYLQNNDFRGITHTVAGTNSFTYINVSGATASSDSTNISNNTFTNLNLNTTGSNSFIVSSYTVAATGKRVVNNNSIVTGFRNTTSNAAGIITGLTSSSTSSAAGATTTYTNNNFSNITVTNATATAITGITISDAAATLNINGNTVSNYSTGANAIIGMSVASFGGTTSSVFNNTIYKLAGQGAITGMTLPSTGTTGNPGNVYSNTIQNLSSTGAGGAVTGLTSANASTVLNIYSNTIDSLSTAGTSLTLNGLVITGATSDTVYLNRVSRLYNNSITSPITNGVVVSGGTTVNLHRNKIYDIYSQRATTTAGATGTFVSGILLSGGTTVNTYNNLIGNLRADSATNADVVRGINLTSTTTSSAHSILNNTIYLRATRANSQATYGSTGVFQTHSATRTTAKMILRNNIVINESENGSSAGIVAAIRRNAATVLYDNYDSTSNKNYLYAGAAGVNNLLYSDGTNALQTKSAFATPLGLREAASILGESSFTSGATFGTANNFFIDTAGSSSNFLHLKSGITTQAEGAADAITTPNINIDFDGDARNASTPDVGADEFNGTTPAPSITNFVRTSPVCTAGTMVVTADVTTPAGTISSVTLNYNNGTTGSVSMTNTTGNTWSGTIPQPASGRITVTWSVTAINSISVISQVSGPSITYLPLTGNNISATASVSSICNGGSTILTGNISQQGSGAISNGSTTEFSGSPFRAGGATGDHRAQYLFTAAELTAAGFTAGNITSLSFNITSGTSGGYNNYTIGLANTSVANLSTTFVNTTGTQVYFNASYTTVVRANTFAFGTGAGSSSSFTWDGTSNLLVNICYTIPTFGTSGTVTASSSTTGLGGVLLGTASSCTVLTGFTAAANRPQITITGNRGASIASISWSLGGTPFSSANPVTVSPTNPTIGSAPIVNTYTATMVSAGCTVTPTVDVTVNAIPLDPQVDGTSPTQCGVPRYIATSLAASPTYNFYTAQTGGTLLATNSTGIYDYTGYTQNATNYVWVSCTVSGCTSDRVQIDVFANAPTSLTITNNTTTCQNRVETLSITTPPGNFNNYLWSPTTNLYTDAACTTKISSSTSYTTVYFLRPTAGSEIITVNATDYGATECANTATTTMTVTANPVVANVTATPTPVCSGSNVALSAQTQVVTAGTATIGAGATTTSTYNAPFYSLWSNKHMQIMFKAAELTSFGMYPGNITSVSFPTTAGTVSNKDYTLKMKLSTGVSNMSAFETTGFTTVFTATELLQTANTNNTFSITPFYWDGTSDLIVEMCWGDASTTATLSSTSPADNTSYVSVIKANPSAATSGSASCANIVTGLLTYSVRPQVKFGAQVLGFGAGTLNWSWNSTSGSGITSTSPSAASGNAVPTNNGSAGTITYMLYLQIMEVLEPLLIVLLVQVHHLLSVLLQ
ncbi:MAG: hypothetical protein NTZ59_11410 [Bacteroidetes bacterium]|nr:hypothetical protein [Bacteroidota bacterium]